MGGDNAWRLPVKPDHRIVDRAGPLVFVGGAGDLDDGGRIRNPGDLAAQIAGAMERLAATLAAKGCRLDDVLRLKAFYRPHDRLDEWDVIARLVEGIAGTPLPGVTANPVPLQPWEGQEIQIQAIAQPGWRGGPVRCVTEDPPEPGRAALGSSMLTTGLRAGEFIVVPGQTAIDPASGALLAPGDGIAQSGLVMARIAETLSGVGAGPQDAVKMEGYYFGTDMATWAGMAAERARTFREPGPVATVVPCHLLAPEGALTRVELLAMRAEKCGFDKYIPRDDCWPERNWDWPIPVPYRQGIRLRDMIWLGGQVPFEPGLNSGKAVHVGDLAAQTDVTMGYIEGLLAGFGRGPGDLALLVCYFASSGTAAETARFVDTLAARIKGPLPPLTLVPQPHMHSPDMGVEIWGVARG